MAKYRVYGVQAQAIVIEEDEQGNIVGQHVLPAELLFFPHGAALEDYLRRKLAELQPKEQKTDGRL